MIAESYLLPTVICGHREISVEKDVIVAIMAGEDNVWKGTLEGFKKLLRGEIKGR